MKTLIRWLRVLFTPSCWIQLYRYNPYWDAKLRELLRTEKFSCIESCHVRLGEYRMWVANHPYASFTINRTDAMRPSRATILEAGDALAKYLVEHPLP